MDEVSTALLQQSYIMGQANPAPPAKVIPPKPVAPPAPVKASYSVVVNSGNNGAGSVSTPMRKTIRPPGAEPYSLVFPAGVPVLLSTNYEREAVAQMVASGFMHEVDLTPGILRQMVKSLK